MRTPTIHESLLLLALGDEDGKPEGHTDLATAAGAVAELTLADRIALDADGVVTAVDTEATGDPVLDAAADHLHAGLDGFRLGKRKLQWAVERVAGLDDLRRLAARRLVAEGVLAEEEKTHLFVFTSHRFPELDGAMEDRLVADIRDGLASTEPVDARLATVIAIANATGLLRNALGWSETRRAKARIAAITDGDAIGDAAAQTIAATNAAVMAAVIAATGATAASS